MEGDLEVKLVRETLIAPDGVHSRVFKVGSVVSLPKMVADGLVRDKLALFTSSDEQTRHDKETKLKLEKEREADERAAAELAKHATTTAVKGQGDGNKGQGEGAKT